MVLFGCGGGGWAEKTKDHHSDSSGR